MIKKCVYIYIYIYIYIHIYIHIVLKCRLSEGNQMKCLTADMTHTASFNDNVHNEVLFA